MLDFFNMLGFSVTEPLGYLMFSIIENFKFIVDESNHNSLIYHFGD